jgi:hypothetical protein
MFNNSQRNRSTLLDIGISAIKLPPTLGYQQKGSSILNNPIGKIQRDFEQSYHYNSTHFS